MTEKHIGVIFFGSTGRKISNLSSPEHFLEFLSKLVPAYTLGGGLTLRACLRHRSARPLGRLKAPLSLR